MRPEETERYRKIPKQIAKDKYIKKMQMIKKVTKDIYPEEDGHLSSWI